MTVVEAIKKVMQGSGKPMTANEVHAEIAREGLYEFRAADPVSIVRAQLRRHCEGLGLTKASERKYFRSAGEGRYELLIQ
jgi:restriction system protein